MHGPSAGHAAAAAPEDATLNAWFVSFAVALAATLSATQFVRVTALRLSAVDRPGGRRVHRRPTARLGGLGIFWGFAGALLLMVYGDPGWKHLIAGAELRLLGLLAGSGAVLILGLVDDVRGLGAGVKLTVQVAAAVTLWSCGWRIESVDLAGLGPGSLGALSLPLTVGWIVFVTNAFNLIDGLDGLACGVALTSTLAMCFILGPEYTFARISAIALAGALLGFLWFNFNPALIFMGDSGSLFVGFVLSAITLRVGHAPRSAFPLVPVMLVALPVLDTVSTIVRRGLRTKRASRSPLDFFRNVFSRMFTADRAHLHHILLLAGLSTRRAVAVLWLVSASFLLSAFLYLRHPVAGLVLAVALGLGWTIGFESLRRRVRAPASLASRAASGSAPPSTPVAGEADIAA